MITLKTPLIVPRSIVDIRQGPEIEGMQKLTTLVLELDDGAIIELALPAYLFTK